MQKHLLSQLVGTILSDELNREDGSTYLYLAAEAYLSRPPKWKFCPVTGLYTQHTHQKRAHQIQLYHR